MAHHNQQPDDISRPVTLYVEKVETNPDVDYFETRRVSVIDVEIPITQAIQIAEYLRERNQDGLQSSIRVRLKGRLVHV